MGREIVYCSQCGVRILEKDLAAGRAFTVLDKVFCAECRDQAFTQAKASAPAARPSAAAPTRVASAQPRTAAPATRPVPRVGASAPHAPRVIKHAPSRTPLYIACGVGMLAMVVVIVVILSRGSGDDKTPGATGPGPNGPKSGPKINPKETPEERAARCFNELHKAVAAAKSPEEAVRLIVAAEKDIVNSPTEEAYRKFRKQAERKVAEAAAAKTIDGWIADVKTIKAADPEYLRAKDMMENLRKAEELAMTDNVDKLADIKNLKKEIEEALEVKADAWMEEKNRGERIRAYMRERDFKAAKTLILLFPEHLKGSRAWKVQLSRNLDDCEKGIAAQLAKEQGKEVAKEWNYYYNIGVQDLGFKNYARAKENLLKAESMLPPEEKRTEQQKRAIAWNLLYNLGCIYAIDAKDLKGEEQAQAVTMAFEYLKRSAEAGVFGHRCGCADKDHKVAKDHWDKDEDLEAIRKDPRYADLITKYAK